METFIARIKDWTDYDVAMHLLALQIGIVDEDKGSFQSEYKWIYWSDNPYGNMLGDMLNKMIEVGVLLYDEEDQKVKYNPDFEIKK